MDTLYNDSVNTNRTPSLSEFRNAGYVVNIEHQRRFRVAYKDPNTGKLIVHTTLGEKQEYEDAGEYLAWEILPKGGKTIVTVVDPVSDLEFFADSTCRDDENYNKRFGVQKCLERVFSLMLVCQHQDKNFQLRVG